MKNKIIPTVITLSLSLLLLAGCEQSSETTGQELKEMTSGVAEDIKNDAIEIKEETTAIIENKTEAVKETATELLDTSKEVVDNAMN